MVLIQRTSDRTLYTVRFRQPSGRKRDKLTLRYVLGRRTNLDSDKPEFGELCCFNVLSNCDFDQHSWENMLLVLCETEPTVTNICQHFKPRFIVRKCWSIF